MAICVGCGLWINPVNGLLEVERKAGGNIQCDDAGLFVNFPASYVPTRSNEICNGLQVRGDGSLFAPKSCTMAGGRTTGYYGNSFPVSLTTAGAGIRTIDNDGGAQVFNNNTDCAVHGVWDVQAYGGGIEAFPGSDFYAYLAISQDAGPYNIAAPATFFRMDNRASQNTHPNGGVVAYNINNLWERNYIHLNPGESHSYTAQLVVKTLTGSGWWHDGGAFGIDFPRFEFHWHFTTEGVC